MARCSRQRTSREYVSMMNGNEKDDESALSPLVTAQERKRRILERRRKEKEQKSDDASLANATSMTAPFGANNTLKRRRSDSNFARGTNLFFPHDNVTPKAGKRTLFGAVMQRTFGSTGASTPTKQRSNDAAASASTPLSNSRASWKNVTTPSSSRSKSFLSANSPCGFALLKVLESVASPFRHDDETSDEESPVPDTKIEEWQEAFLRNDSIGVVDWSIKRKLRLECHPRCCLPQASDWEAARSYWQHPAMYPLPTFEGQENETSQSTREVSATMHPLSHLADMVRGRDALLHRLVRQDPRLWKERRNREWQEAFRSLYFKWIEQVEALQQAWENREHISPETVTRTYFYAMTPGQTILFRVGMDPSNDSSNERPLIVPIIVLSSTTFHLRSKLRSMGAKLFYSNDQKVEFEEAVLERRKAEKTTQDETDNVHQELEALRRAQAHGQTAGADVSIATKTKTATKSPRSVPPLCLIGDEDCFAFFEFYLNTLGRGTTWLQGNGDVPLLLSRKVGPFVHASLQSLPVTSRREASESQDKSTDDNHAAIDLRGPILPCAMVELVCTAASRMIQDTPGNGQPSSGSADDVGSHYFVVQAQAHDGEERPHGDNAGTGSVGSRWMNGGIDFHERLASDGDGLNKCEHGEVLSMIVWDIARPSMIAYKTEPRLI